jgi:hypothetical protein
MTPFAAHMAELMEDYKLNRLNPPRLVHDFAGT